MYKFNTSKKNQIIALWVLSHTKYKVALVFCILSLIVGVLLFVFLRGWLFGFLITQFTPFKNNKETALPIATVFAIIIGLIPVFGAYKLQAGILRGLEEPYRSMVNEQIILTENTFEYSYHYKYNPNPTALEYYVINYEDIEEVVFRAKYNIMTIYGKGSIQLKQNKHGYLNVIETSNISTNTESFSMFVALFEVNDFLQELSKYTTINITRN